MYEVTLNEATKKMRPPKFYMFVCGNLIAWK
jgi:hypothetical protein